MSLESRDRPEIPGDEAFRRAHIKGTQWEPTYAGALSFMRRKYSRDLPGVDIAITGIPFDQATSHRPGTRFGPEAIRKASAECAWGPIWPWMFDPFETLAVVDYGDCYFDWGRKDVVPEVIERHAAAIIETGAEMITLGGDHFISYPLLKAHARVHGPLSLVHFDAHRDVEPDDGGRIDHGTMFNYAVRDGVIDAKRSIQIGIRTTFTGERQYGFTILYADRVHDMTAADVAAEINRAVAGNKAYLTFDIDCLDPSVAPGTGTPVPGGLSYHQAASIIRKLTDVNFVAMDLVEVSPPYDHADITALAAANLIMEYICLRAWQKGARGETLPP
ncbi:agmatinase [soil metagenome]